MARAKRRSVGPDANGEKPTIIRYRPPGTAKYRWSIRQGPNEVLLSQRQMVALLAQAPVISSAPERPTSQVYAL